MVCIVVVVQDACLMVFGCKRRAPQLHPAPQASAGFRCLCGGEGLHAATRFVVNLHITTPGMAMQAVVMPSPRFVTSANRRMGMTLYSRHGGGG